MDVPRWRLQAGRDRQLSLEGVFMVKNISQSGSNSLPGDPVSLIVSTPSIWIYKGQENPLLKKNKQKNNKKTTYVFNKCIFVDKQSMV